MYNIINNRLQVRLCFFEIKRETCRHSNTEVVSEIAFVVMASPATWFVPVISWHMTQASLLESLELECNAGRSPFPPLISVLPAWPWPRRLALHLLPFQEYFWTLVVKFHIPRWKETRQRRYTPSKCRQDITITLLTVLPNADILQLPVCIQPCVQIVEKWILKKISDC